MGQEFRLGGDLQKKNFYIEGGYRFLRTGKRRMREQVQRGDEKTK